MDELLANYEALAAERDWSHDQMADHLEPLDARLAAEYRKAHAKADKPAAAPKARRSKADAESNEG